MRKLSGIERAVLSAGGQSALARLIGDGVRQSRVADWLSKGYVPERRARLIVKKLPHIKLADLVRPIEKRIVKK